MHRWLWLIIIFVLATIIFLVIAVQRVSLLEREADQPRIKEAFARGIAAGSACAQQGTIAEMGAYNRYTATWWFDLAIKKELAREGCSPACVVDTLTSTAEINWRCTGLRSE